MKAKWMLFASCFSLLLTHYSYAGCGGCGGGCYENNCAPACCDYDTPCQCHDIGVNWNDCMTRCDYCEAFGNIGGR